MAIPTSRSPLATAAVLHVGAAGARIAPQQTSVPNPPPFVDQSTAVVGTDSATFTLGADESQVVTFANLPTRAPGNPQAFLTRQASAINVRPTDALHFAAVAQTSSSPVSVQPLVIEHSGAQVPGPYLGGSNRYRTFQARVTSLGSAATGTVVGTLTLLVGAGG